MPRKCSEFRNFGAESRDGPWPYCPQAAKQRLCSRSQDAGWARYWRPIGKYIHGNRIKLRHGKTGPRMVCLATKRARFLTRSRASERYHGCSGIPVADVPSARSPTIGGNFATRLSFLACAAASREQVSASHAAMNTETLPMSGRLPRHARIGSISRYAHLDDEHMLDAGEQIGAAIERMMR